MTAEQGKPPQPGGDGLTVEFRVHFKNGNRGRRRLRLGESPAPVHPEPGNVPRITKLLALAIRFDGLLHQGVVRDYADLARLGHVSRPRISQIMNLPNLAPDIQEEILFMPRTVSGRDKVTERQIRAIAATADWGQQRAAWATLSLVHGMDGPAGSARAESNVRPSGDALPSPRAIRAARDRARSPRGGHSRSARPRR